MALPLEKDFFAASQSNLKFPQLISATHRVDLIKWFMNIWNSISAEENPVEN